MLGNSLVWMLFQVSHIVCTADGKFCIILGPVHFLKMYFEDSVYNKILKINVFSLKILLEKSFYIPSMLALQRVEPIDKTAA